MGKKLSKYLKRLNILKLMNNAMDHNVAAFAAQSAFFFVLSMIPILLLLLTLILNLPLAVTRGEIVEMAVRVFPSSVESLITSIINQVYDQSNTFIPFTIIVAIWSAGRGVVALTSGLNKIYSTKEKRNYLMVRIRASFYTLIFIVVIVLILIISVFGNTLRDFIVEHAPITEEIIGRVLRLRNTVSPFLVMIFTVILFKFLPSRHTKFKYELPGAIFAALGWSLISWIFSVYLKIFSGFATMYGSLTTIILVMMWLYFCMYCILIGGEVNVLLFPKAEEKSVVIKENDIKEQESLPKQGLQ
ncbi:MAG: YihY/virulence factor BrkB family protein [Suipraeoptans sp.]